MRTLTSVCYFLCLVYLFNGARGFKIPAPFDYAKLPARLHAGDRIDHLGHIIKLNTLLPPIDVERITTKFRIYTRHSISEEMTFTPGKYCLPEVSIRSNRDATG